jgi:hypothetical protein
MFVALFAGGLAVHGQDRPTRRPEVIRAARPSYLVVDDMLLDAAAYELTSFDGAQRIRLRGAPVDSEGSDYAFAVATEPVLIPRSGYATYAETMGTSTKPTDLDHEALAHLYGSIMRPPMSRASASSSPRSLRRRNGAASIRD